MIIKIKNKIISNFENNKNISDSLFSSWGFILF